MLQSKKFLKKTRNGQVRKVVREHYLRDDISSGSPLDPECNEADAKLSADAKQYLIVDTNVALQQMDLLEHKSVEDVIVLSVVLEEVKARNLATYGRLRKLCAAADRRFFVFANEHHSETYIKGEPGESPNDRNDRAIRVAAAWYCTKLPTVEILMLSNDVDNRKKAAALGIRSMSVQAYVKTRSDADELADLVAQSTAAEGKAGGEQGGTAGRPAKRARIFTDHCTMTEITAGIKAGRLHQGTLRVNRFNTYEGFVSSESVGTDILVSGRVDMNRAFDGDAVAVELLPENQWRLPAARLPGSKSGAIGDTGGDDSEEEEDRERNHGDRAGIAEVVANEDVAEGLDATSASGATSAKPTGRIVGIIRRNWRTRGYAGSLQPSKRGGGGRTASCLFCPVERRFPMIRVQTRQFETLMDKRIVVAVDGWAADSAYPTGHYTSTLGKIGDRDTETEVLLLEHDIITSPFTPAVHACVPPLPWSVSQEDIEEPCREDLRRLAVCSVDPPGCKDIDDALHVRKLDNGNLEVGVHIADVTTFLRPSTAMDDEAALRGTTCYLVQRRIDMLPKPLTEDICSLRSDVERLAFSVLWEMKESAEIVSYRFTKSIIRSRAALTYAEAQTRIDDTRLHDEVSTSLRQLNSLAKQLRRGRQDAGALSLASPEVRFEIDTETHDPLDVGVYQVREANQMVEEMMLLANTTVAAAILKAFPTCALLRRHPTPPPKNFEPLLTAAAAAGFALDVSSSKALAKSLDEAERKDDVYFNKLVRIMATRCMMQAVYLGSAEVAPPEYHHYGLAAPLYTHFTSPIRRYADVMVHRLLAASLGIAQLPASAQDRSELHSLAANLNERHRNAQFAGRASVELHTLIFFKNRPITADARIVKVRQNGIIVFVPKFGIEGPVYFVAKGAEAEAAFTIDETKQCVSAVDGSASYTVFDKVAVFIKVEEAAGGRRQLVLTLASRDDLDSSALVG